SIAKAILDLHGGSIQAESAGLGEGSTFRVELPATEAPVEGAPENTSANVEARGPRPLRLLLVDDHQSTVEVLERLLTRAGHRVTTTISVAGALRAAEDGIFDAVISDLGLPDGTGYELMGKLRSQHRLRGIALSGYGMDEDLRRSQEAGFAAHLTKPIDFAQLERALVDLMEGVAPFS
ncbi:MAG: response regulator, partial [Verrucomicrobiaceae bacterium]|nr:response regulator [Verrucomicrobiaceae bacterium]